ncbi:diacylglycerol/polyprenol kinase family protein [Paraliomyxa miuraensis]|uniref:diacylglycerol/polyprenol kinase family protein n=1 Tax=Paraliomyxa miuraensis TaxID=376150 RepID=UPI002255A1D6|nr:hypothetical protein [Paraliomyxa miuraensis]MCX4246746.1 hypothetical protein [Paraliomyxa miuraensis]
MRSTKSELLDALHELVDVCEVLGVHAPSPSEQQRVRDCAARVHEALAGLDDGDAMTATRADVVARVDALLAGLGDDEHEPSRWRSIRTPLLERYERLHRAWGDGDDRRVRQKPHNLARTGFHVLSGVMWALLYEYVLAREVLLWVLGACLVFFLTDDAMRRWFPERRSGFAVVVFRMLSRSSESSGIASSTWYALGLMVGVAFLPKPACMIGLLILAFGDPAAGVVGRRFGVRKIYRDKSVAGTLAFVGVAVVVAAVGLEWWRPMMEVGAWLGVAVVIAIAGAVAEVFGDTVPDNFSVLVVTGGLAAWFG